MIVSCSGAVNRAAKTSATLNHLLRTQQNTHAQCWHEQAKLPKQGLSVSDYSFKNCWQKRSRRSIWIHTQEKKTVESRELTGQNSASLFHSLIIQAVCHITPASCISLARSLTIQTVIRITPAPWISLLHSLTIQTMCQITPASCISLARSLTIQNVIRITPASWISLLLSLITQAVIQLTLGPNPLLSS